MGFTLRNVACVVGGMLLCMPLLAAGDGTSTHGTAVTHDADVAGRWRPWPDLSRDDPRAMRANAGGDADIAWTDVRELTIRGRAFNDTKAFYNRLPAAAEGVVRAPVWALSQDTAGFFVRFQSNASALYLNYTLLSSSLNMIHFPTSGVSGCDCYVWSPGNTTWRWVGTTTNIVYPASFNTLATDLPVPADGSLNTYRLHLPTYNGVIDMQVGVPASENAVLQADTAYKPGPPIVWYGTSICQGAVASRPGQAYTNLISRNISREIWNFGFSGNGIMEITVAQFLTLIDAAVFIIDCLPNMTPDMVAQRTVPLVKYFRQKHPTTPIVLAEGTTYGQDWLVAETRDTQQAKRDNLRTAYNELVAGGDKHLFYVTGNQLLDIDNDLVNPTVSGTHPTDLGMYKFAEYYEQYLPKLLAGEVPQPPPFTVPTPQHRGRTSVPETVASAAPMDSRADVEFTWTSLVDLGVLGRGFDDTSTPFTRLPASAQGKVRQPVWELSEFSTGLFVAFRTDSQTIMINYTLTHEAVGLWHMPTTGTSGCDLYRWQEGNKTWRFAATVFDFEGQDNNIVTTLVDGLPTGMADYMLYLPLRNGLVKGYIGTAPGSTITAGSSLPPATPSPADSRPIVWYGTSILQGGVAARAAQAYSNVLTRRLGRVILNFGFAGNGKMELDVASYLTTIDAAAFIIDCNPNLDAEEIAERTQPLVKFFRADHPTTPIVLVEGTTYGAYWYSKSVSTAQNAKRAALRAAYDALVKGGDQYLHYVTGDQLFGHPLVNPTVGGTHPSDLGQYDIVRFYQDYLPKLLTSA